MTHSERTIRRTLVIRAPRAQVFRALMDPGTLSRWLFAAVDLKSEPGSAFSIQWRDSASPATAQGEILDLVPEEKLVLSWFMEADGVTSTASFRLQDAPEGATALHFEQAGLPGEPEWLPRFHAVSLEWDKVLLNLRFVLEEQGEGKHLFYLRMQAPLPALAPRAFRAWTTTTGLSAWLAGQVFVAAEEGQQIEGVTVDTGKALTARFEKIEPERHLRFTWSEGGIRGLLGVSFWPAPGGLVLTMTLRSFALLEMERPFVQSLWEKRFQRLAAYLSRPPLEKQPAGKGSLTVERPFEAPPNRVYNALTDSGILRRWFVRWTDFEPRPGAPFTLLWDGYGEVCGRVKHANPDESIVYSWDISELGETTEVAIRILPDPAQAGLCRLVLEHRGWGEGEAWEEQRLAHECGWAGALALLDFYLRHGAGKVRQEFQLRRRLPLASGKVVPLFTTAQGWQAWLARRASIDPHPGGEIHLEMPDGSDYRGRIASLHPSGDGSAEFATPAPLFLDWGFAPEKDRTRIGLTLTTYSALPEWLEAVRVFWTAGLDKLAAGS